MPPRKRQAKAQEKQEEITLLCQKKTQPTLVEKESKEEIDISLADAQTDVTKGSALASVKMRRSGRSTSKQARAAQQNLQRTGESNEIE